MSPADNKIIKPEKEITEYEVALRLNRWPHGDKRFLTHYNLALAYKNVNRIDEAIKHLKEAIKIYPKFPDAYNNLGAILTRQKKYDEAFDCFIKALTYNNKSYQAHHNLGVSLLMKRRIDEAIIEFNKSLGIEKDFAPALLGLGIAYKHKKEFLKAKHYLMLALEKNRRNIVTRFHLIETLFLMGDKNLLDVFLAQTLDIIPFEKMNAVIQDIVTDNFPDQEAPNLEIILPLLEKAQAQRLNVLGTYRRKHIEERAKVE